MAAKILTALTRASGLLTLGSGDSQLPHAADTTIVGSVTYTWRASVTTTANEVKIGTTLAGSISNLNAAINGEAGGGTTYGSLTTAIVVLLSLEIAATLLLLGAQVISEYERIGVADADREPAKFRTA